jgi:hypothetical protein
MSRTGTPSATLIQRNIERVQREILQFTESNVRRVLAKRIEEEAVEGSSLSDHTLKDLARLGHPYAKRLPKGSAPHPDYLIHHQTAATGLAFVDAFRSEITAEGGRGIVYRLRNLSYFWPYLKEGTRVMRRRPLHEWLAQQVKRHIWREWADAQKTAMTRLRGKFQRKPGGR